MARLSKSGDAKPASGDIEADPLEIDATTKGQITLVLNRTLP
jgi:hypothetical protein